MKFLGEGCFRCSSKLRECWMIIKLSPTVPKSSESRLIGGAKGLAPGYVRPFYLIFLYHSFLPNNYCLFSQN